MSCERAEELIRIRCIPTCTARDHLQGRIALPDNISATAC